MNIEMSKEEVRTMILVLELQQIRTQSDINKRIKADEPHFALDTELERVTGLLQRLQEVWKNG